MRQLLQTTRAYALLKAERAENRLSHAYLLVFDDARNLRAALKEFAKLFFLPASGPEAGGAEAARNGQAINPADRIGALIDEESFADCVFLPGPGQKFSVEDAERVREESALKPVESDTKLFVISDFAESTAQAQNKLLKLLEEPPAGVRLLLGATVTFPVLPTILSRTEKLEIPPFSTREVADCLKRLYPGTADTALCAAASGGSVGTAQNILEGGYYRELLSTAFELAETDPFRLPALVRRAGETRYKRELLTLLRLIFRDALILKTSRINGVDKSSRNGKNRAEKYLTLRSETERLQKISESYLLRALLCAQEALTEAEKQIRFNAVFPQCLELCMAKIFASNNR